MNLYITATQARHFQVFHDGKLLAEGRLWATQGIVGQFKLKQPIPLYEVESQITHCLSVKRVVDILHKGGSCLINGARQANSGESLVVEFPQETDEQKPDLRLGNYYVSARDSDNYWLLAGPWPTHAEALAQVQAVWDYALRVDPVGAEWKAFGTCRRPPEDAQFSKLGTDPASWAYVEPALPKSRKRR